MKLLIADSNESGSRELSASLGSTYTIKICRSGTEALDLLRSFRPDILVLDILIPGMDGISLLQQAEQEGILPTVLAMSRFISDYIVESANRLGIDYLISKPYDIASVISRLADLTQKIDAPLFTEPDPRSYISGMLLTLGFSTKLRGYVALREAVLLMAEDRAQSITKEIYPAVARHMSSSPIQIERQIRSSIENAWTKRDAAVWNRYFPEGARRPTNLAVISRLADCLCMKYKPG